jgi:hemin uptake protein HemP
VKAPKPMSDQGNYDATHPGDDAEMVSKASLSTIDSAELFGGANEIRIVHGQALYRLKITRQGKLILNK